MPIGRQTLSPYMALWYVRSRKTTSDLDRGRRQMDVLRAMWYQAREQGLFAQVTQLWPEAVEVVETDMTLTDVLSLVPLAVSLDMSNIARYSGTRGVHYIPFVTPDDGRDVVLPDMTKLMPLIQDFLTPPTGNRLGRKLVSVEVVDMSACGIGFDQVAVDRLAWEGFAAFVTPITNYGPREVTHRPRLYRPDERQRPGGSAARAARGRVAGGFGAGPEPDGRFPRGDWPFV